MANAGAQQGPQEYLGHDEPMAHNDAAPTVNQGTATQGVKRARDGAESAPADDSKRRRQARDAKHSQAPDPAADDKAEQDLAQDELARSAEDMLVKLKQVATRAAASWRKTAPSIQQKQRFDKQVRRTMLYAKRAFPAAAAALPLSKVPAVQRHAIVLLQQAMEASKHAHDAYDGWRGELEYELPVLTSVAERSESAWSQAAPTQAQVSELQRWADTTWELVEMFYPAAAAGLPAVQVPACEAYFVDPIAEAKAAVSRALSVAKKWQVVEGQEGSVKMQDAAAAWSETAATAAAEGRGPPAVAGLALQRAPKRRATSPTAAAAAVPPTPSAAAAAPGPAAGSSRSAMAGQAVAATAAAAAKAATAGHSQPAMAEPAATAAAACSEVQYIQHTARVDHTHAADWARHEAVCDARAAAAAAACRVVWRRALAAISEWDRKAPTPQQALDLKQEVESAKLLAWDIWGVAGSEQPIVTWMSVAVNQALDTAVAAAVREVGQQASAVKSTCLKRPATDGQMQTLEAAHATAQALVAASPDPSAHTALSAQVTAAVAAARAAQVIAANRASVHAALIAARDRARAATVAWKERPPTIEEVNALIAAFRKAEALLSAHPGFGLEGLWQVARKACERAKIAAKAAAAAMAERRPSAQQALQSFTQQALLLRADWARKGRDCPPGREEYLPLLQQGRQARELAKQAFPEAYAHVQRRQQEPGAEPHAVPDDEAHAVRLIGDARSAWQSASRMWRAWEYVSTLPGSAVAA